MRTFLEGKFCNHRYRNRDSKRIVQNGIMFLNTQKMLSINSIFVV